MDTLLPCIGIRRLRGLRPVAFGPLWGLVVLVAAEFEDVPLRDAQVLEEHPGGVREVGGLGAVEFGPEVFDGVFKCGVGVATFQEFEEMFAQGLGRVFGHRFPPRDWMLRDSWREQADSRFLLSRCYRASE